MGFLDNSGDIILDAVLTDTGRMRLAKGDGSFKISKFALADDEIDYALYDKNNVSGSAYYDLQILQTPVLEAFTNNIASMKSRLITIGRNDILYLPEIVLNQRTGIGSSMNAANTFIVPVDETTIINLGQVLGSGILNGYRPGSDTSKIRFDQGLNTNQLAAESPLSDDLVETQYIVQIDNRLGQIFPPPEPAARPQPTQRATYSSQLQRHLSSMTIPWLTIILLRTRPTGLFRTSPVFRLILQLLAPRAHSCRCGLGQA
mgnify:CR=1 FL=1